jgi:hypothetical protein
MTTLRALCRFAGCVPAELVFSALFVIVLALNAAGVFE